ncbi:MAG TPA: proteasome activator [Pseudonocardia sp.]|uniref:proteasome activator n=1 Tax=Pseudonocardia sp. TaxID=60912 RepID=UPI002CF2F703|nr:proteasome activator [Pseudonocardia sp.]HTF51175.1 proteasome activator [Pseudonocardia sp.]
MSIEQTRAEMGPHSAAADQAALSRLGSMAAQLLEELRSAPVDAAGLDRLHNIHTRTLAEIHHRLPMDLRGELDRITGSPQIHTPVSMPELRIAQAQLVGWVKGVFAGAQLAAAIEHPDHSVQAP